MTLRESKFKVLEGSLVILIRHIEVFTFPDLVILRFYSEKSNALKFDIVYFMIGRRNINA